MKLYTSNFFPGTRTDGNYDLPIYQPTDGQTGSYGSNTNNTTECWRVTKRSVLFVKSSKTVYQKSREDLAMVIQTAFLATLAVRLHISAGRRW